MTIREQREYKRAAQEAMKENGMTVWQKDMVLLETGSHSEKIEFETFSDVVTVIDYVMFEDRATGREWQCHYGPRYYNSETGSLWYVNEYVA